jgi:hypothetical protein
LDGVSLDPTPMNIPKEIKEEFEKELEKYKNTPNIPL